MSELTYEEFCALPLRYQFGMIGDWGASRIYRNDEHGLQKEVHTNRKTYGDLYSGWEEGVVTYWLDGDDREFASVADLYVAYMEAVCGVVA